MEKYHNTVAEVWEFTGNLLRDPDVNGWLFKVSESRPQPLVNTELNPGNGFHCGISRKEIGLRVG